MVLGSFRLRALELYKVIERPLTSLGQMDVQVHI